MKMSHMAAALALSAQAYPGPTGIITPTAADLADLTRYGRKNEPDAVQELRALKTDIATNHAMVKSWTEKAANDIAAFGKIANETKEGLAKAATAGEQMIAKFTELEQMVAQLKAANTNRIDVVKSVGARVIESEDFKSYIARPGTKKGKFSMEVKEITSATSGSGAAGDLILPQRVPGIIRQPDRLMTIRDLLSVGRTTSNLVEYVREVGFTNNAAPVPEGQTKPQSTVSFQLFSTPIRTIAHWMLATVQVLDDVPALQSYIDTRLRFGLEIEEEDQLLAGDGTGENLLGLIPQATPFDAARRKIGDTRIDIVRRAMTQVRLAEYRPDGIVMHPNDWEQIELTKTSEGAYVWANPRGLLGPTLWGLPVVETTAVDPGEFLVGNFRQAAQIWDRQNATVDISTEDSDNFRKNLVTIRAEQRIGLAVYRPEAIIVGDFDEVVSS